MSSRNLFERKHDLNLWPITLLRVYTGVFFAWHGFRKISGGNFGEGLKGFVSGRLDDAFGFFRPFLESVVLPYNEVFAYLVSWGELLVGLALIVGLATRYASIAGAIMLMSFWFTKGQSILDGQNHDSIWVMIFIVLAVVHAGRQHGLDARLGQRFRFLS